jgi:hypothetical protein
MNAKTSSFRHGLPESRLQGSFKPLSVERVCHPWTMDTFDTSLYLTLRAARLCKSAVLPICPTSLIGMTALFSFLTILIA